MVTRSVVSIETYEAAVAAGAIIPSSAAMDVSLQNTSTKNVSKQMQTQPFNNHQGRTNSTKQHGFCNLHQAESIAVEQMQKVSEDPRNISEDPQDTDFDDRCIGETSSDEGHGDTNLAAHGSNCSSSEVGKKRVCLSEDPTSVKEMTKRQRCSTFAIDLSDVPKQTPILKIGKRKEGQSKYQGVCFNKKSNKWMAHIMIEGRRHYIGGRYDNEEDAGIDYARAVFKFRGQKAIDKGRAQHSFTMDLSDVPLQAPILRTVKREEGQSKYQGVTFDKQNNKWQARIMIEGTQRSIGYYANEEEAAIDYARALFKYRGETFDKARAHDQDSFRMDLSDVPPQLPIPIRGKHIKEGASQYQGVCFNKNRNNWMAQIFIEGRSRYIGTYEKEEDAAADYARAVFKYRGRNETLDDCNSERPNSMTGEQSEVTQRQRSNAFVIDLSDVPKQSPILKGDKTNEGQSKYRGVSFIKQRNKWEAKLVIEGKGRYIGYYENEEDAETAYATMLELEKSKETKENGAKILLHYEFA